MWAASVLRRHCWAGTDWLLCRPMQSLNRNSQSEAIGRSRHRCFGLLLALTLVAAVGFAAPFQRSLADSRLVFELIYNYLIVSRDGSVVRFSRMENGATVSAIDLADPRRQVVAYTGMLFGAALAKRDPASVLSVGLGAGAINRLFPAAFPNTKLTTVEIDPMILDVAKTHTGFSESANDQVVIGDGRRYIARSSDKWDWVVLDAFVRNSQVPFHLTTVEFYRLIADHLTDDGVLVSNLHYGGPLFESHLRTLKEVFPQVILFGGASTGNVIAAAVKYPSPDLLVIVREGDAKGLPDLKPWVDLADLRRMASSVDAAAMNGEASVLTDDFAPVEYLDLKSR